ncbi:MAG: hypothetical protein ACO23V_08175 [Chitinophagaceae bacterium]
MIVHKHECSKYKCNLYQTNDDILILDIFYDNSEKYEIKIYYHDNIINITKFKIHENYYYINDSDCWWRHGFDVCEKEEEEIDCIKINFNKIFPILKDYSIYNAEKRKNITMVTFMRKNLLKQFSPQIDENKIYIRW